MQQNLWMWCSLNFAFGTYDAIKCIFIFSNLNKVTQHVNCTCLLFWKCSFAWNVLVFLGHCEVYYYEDFYQILLKFSLLRLFWRQFHVRCNVCNIYLSVQIFKWVHWFRCVLASACAIAHLSGQRLIFWGLAAICPHMQNYTI